MVDGGRGEGDYSSQIRAWDCSLNALDGPNCLNVTMWTYVPDNSHEWGDLWNGEDLSIWSKDDMERPSEVYQDDDRDDSTRVENAQDSKPFSFNVETASPLYTPDNIMSGEGVTPALILDGARAVSATCRPFPIAIVGEPYRIDFDIASTTFKLSVRVRADDTPSSDVATEIYVPFVHYAANLDSVERYADAGPSRRGSASSLSSSKQDSKSNDAKVTVTSAAASSSSSQLSPISAQSTNPGLKLDISVRVTQGTYSTSGQTLKWTYKPPPSGTAIYSIEIKRNGGAMRRDVGYVQQGSWFDVCSGGCVIS